jgi:hypothetical protein
MYLWLTMSGEYFYTDPMNTEGRRNEEDASKGGEVRAEDATLGNLEQMIEERAEELRGWVRGEFVRVKKEVDANFDQIAESSRQRLTGRRKSNKEAVLSSGEIAEKKKLLGGSVGGATFVEIKGDGSGVFKPHPGYTEDVQREYAARERAAYLISQFLEFDLVPPTVLKKVGGELGSLQEFIEDAKVAAECENTLRSQHSRLEKQLERLAVFDLLIGNDDRHGGNYLIKNGEVFAIDHGLALNKNDLGSPHAGRVRYDGLIPNIRNKKLDDNLVLLLKNFDQWVQGQRILEEQLGELFDPEVAKGWVQRIKNFIASIRADGVFDFTQFETHLSSAK